MNSPLTSSLPMFFSPVIVVGHTTWSLGKLIGLHGLHSEIRFGILEYPGSRGGRHLRWFTYKATNGSACVILAGANNIVSGNSTSISGGDQNTANGDRGSILGGFLNHNSGVFSTILGGAGNSIDSSLSNSISPQNLALFP